MRLTVTCPSRANDEEVGQVQSLILLGGAVSTEGLADRIDQAVLLVLVQDARGAAACAAIKRPAPSYGERLGVPLWSFEFGWLVVRPDLRGRGLAATLRRLVLSLVPQGVVVFCTRSASVGGEGLDGFELVHMIAEGRLALWIRSK